ncbi:MAG: deoxyribonuclease IV [Firmicutes bacterium]|nr:deoxyribonuclease IV [Bacillota bacterium]
MVAPRQCSVPSHGTWRGHSRAIAPPHTTRTHPGRPGKGTGPGEARRLVVESVLRAFEMAPDAAARVRLLLENTSGAGHELGASLEEVAALAEAIEEGLGVPGRVGFCLDTCHAHAAGYDLRHAAGVSALVGRVTELLGRDRLAVVHANDSLGEVGSRRDRHAPIGRGTIGEAGFRALLAEPHFAGCPFLVETPGSDEDRAADVARLKRLRAGEALEG